MLLPNYLLQYFEIKEAYQIGIQPKGSIDLTQATKILVYDKTSNLYSMGIKCPERIWKSQCERRNQRRARGVGRVLADAAEVEVESVWSGLPAGKQTMKTF